MHLADPEKETTFSAADRNDEDIILASKRKNWPNALPIDWRLVNAAVIAAGLAVLIGAFTQSKIDDQVLFAAKWTARISSLFFLATFSATGVYSIWPSPSTLWLARRRRSFGISFAFAHFIHLGALITFYVALKIKIEFSEVAIAGFGYVILVLMTVTSFKFGRRRLQPRFWRGLHLFGLHYLTGVFLLIYGHAALEEPSPWPIAAIVCLIGVFLLRTGVAVRDRTGRNAANIVVSQ